MRVQTAIAPQVTCVVSILLSAAIGVVTIAALVCGMRLPTPLLFLVVMSTACSGDPASPNGGPGASNKAVAVAFTGGTVNAEIAALRAQRDTGLMNRATIAADSGMLFVWAADQNTQLVAFWMKDTHFDLSVAFLDAAKRVINIEDMTKETLTFHYATAPFRYALEAPRGWFASHGVAAGATATFTLPAGVIIDP